MVIHGVAEIKKSFNYIYIRSDHFDEMISGA